MEAEPSVLQQIRRKEVEINVRVDQARRDAEQIIADAKKEAATILSNAETDGRNAAEEDYKRRLASVLDEVNNLKKLGNEEATAVKLKGEQNLSKAIDKIIKSVTLE